MQVLQGLEDLEMTGEIGLVNRQEVEVVIPKWWTWWRWLRHSPTVWKTSHEGLKSLTPVPNPIRISPQMQVTCRWKRVLMHKYYNMSMHQYFLCFVTMLDCMLFASLSWKLFAFVLNVFTLLLFDQSFLAFMSKIQKHIKSWKSKKVDRHRWVLSQNIFYLVPLY